MAGSVGESGMTPNELFYEKEQFFQILQRSRKVIADDKLQELPQE